MEHKLDFSVFEGQGQIASIFTLFLPDVIQDYPNLKILSSDMSYGARLERFKAFYPEHFLNVGIAEENLIGVSAGLASEGYKCVALAQATFITMRCYEQVRQYMSYMGYPIVLIGLSAGLIMQFMGNTHYAIEDLAIMRVLPGVEVLSPADAGEAVKAFEYALGSNKPCYIRLTGNADAPLIFKDYGIYCPNKANVLKDGKDIAVIATGSMVTPAIEAAKKVEQNTNLTIRVIDMHSLQPLDKDVIEQCRNCKLVVTVEEHYVTGGMGSSVADELITKTNAPQLIKLGINNKYSTVGDYEFLLEQHGLTSEKIAGKIMDVVNK
jgi:transketolase